MTKKNKFKPLFSRLYGVVVNLIMSLNDHIYFINFWSTNPEVRTDKGDPEVMAAAGTCKCVNTSIFSVFHYCFIYLKKIMDIYTLIPWVDETKYHQ